jgi:endonuclease/exonuclease/phosphatase family metal-dependent hydrolase
MRIATFNVQNLRMRQDTGGTWLEGARDRDSGLPEDRRLDVMDRRLTAAIIARIDPDILCLQEVFDQATLEYFHDAFLVPTGLRPYPVRICEPGNDGHGLNVAVMARRAADRVRSHAQATAADLGFDDTANLLRGGPVFRRDCLEVGFGALTLFVCHLKAPYPDRARAAAIRSLEALAIRRVVAAALPDPARHLWMIVGDLNTPLGTDASADAALRPILDGFAIDLMTRMPPGEDWTFAMPETGEHLRPDAMLASPALARHAPEAVPTVERRGMDVAAARSAGFPLSEVGAPRPHASDHAAVWIDLPEAIFPDGAGARPPGHCE